ncbi:hypothetical protein PSHT_01990 [Puccinia striiformis]|uniref:Uncharacterized protein n=2 Tax=Puccinia striiformis TaxID=27350 RepID=A0A0L0V6R6_9BASI|nr:hypothetical protein PSTG_11744 [Puccinia striiformis f. sp. tritici PST-78]POW21789.1 hypothetical protein PSHT_01990 [Puccinia striiformis]
MASHRSNLRNKHKISGQMLGIGFRDGYERGESAGIFAVCKTLKEIQLQMDQMLQGKLFEYNCFIAH